MCSKGLEGSQLLCDLAARDVPLASQQDDTACCIVDKEGTWLWYRTPANAAGSVAEGGGAACIESVHPLACTIPGLTQVSLSCDFITMQSYSVQTKRLP